MTKKEERTEDMPLPQAQPAIENKMWAEVEEDKK